MSSPLDLKGLWEGLSSKNTRHVILNVRIRELCELSTFVSWYTQKNVSQIIARLIVQVHLVQPRTQALYSLLPHSLGECRVKGLGTRLHLIMDIQFRSFFLSLSKYVISSTVDCLIILNSERQSDKN